MGRFSVDLAYMDVGSGLYLGGTGWQTDLLSSLACSGGGYDEVKFWNLLAQVVVMPNVYVHGECAFAADGKGAAGDPDDTWTLSLNYILSRMLTERAPSGSFFDARNQFRIGRRSGAFQRQRG